MTLNSLVIRIVACGTAAASGFLYATEAGLIDGVGPAQAESGPVNEQTASSGSGPSVSPTLVTPVIRRNADVQLPQTSRPVDISAMVRPASFEPQSADPVQIASADGATAFSALGLPCDVSVNTTAMPAAMIALDVMAPCDAGATVTLIHSGLRIEGTLDAMGLLTVDLPAFETPAYVEVRMNTGADTYSSLVDVPDLQDFDRIGLAWQGDMGLELHAMEFGAGFGTPGHVWHEAPAVAAVATSGEGGFLTSIDTEYSHAQIYTLPRATLREGDSVRLSVDAPITAQNCSQDVAARTLRSSGAAPVTVTDLSMTMPPCDTVGDVLVLQNLLEDLRLASN